MGTISKLADWQAKKKGKAGPEESSEVPNTLPVLGAPEKIVISGIHSLAILNLAPPILKKLQTICTRNEQKVKDLLVTVREYTDEQVLHFLGNANETDLKKRPMFYYALIDEAGRRAKLIMQQPT